MRVGGKVVDIREAFWTSVELTSGQVIDARLGKSLAHSGADLQIGDRVVVMLAGDDERHRNTIIYRTSDPTERLAVDAGPVPSGATREGLVRRGIIKPAKAGT
jgi:hypothetical protein